MKTEPTGAIQANLTSPLVSTSGKANGSSTEPIIRFSEIRFSKAVSIGAHTVMSLSAGRAKIGNFDVVGSDIALLAGFPVGIRVHFALAGGITHVRIFPWPVIDSCVEV